MDRHVLTLLSLVVIFAACSNAVRDVQVVDDRGPVAESSTTEEPADVADPASLFKPVSQRVSVEDCPNCKPDMSYQPGGPQPYAGTFCPICQSVGKLWGTIHWEDGHYDAPGFSATRKKRPTGQHKLMARRGAEIAAVRNAVRLAMAIRLDEDNMLAVRSGEIQLDAFVRGHQATAEKWYPGSGEPWCRKHVKVPMYGVSGLNARVIDHVSSSYRRTASLFQATRQIVMTEEVTHIVVDARELEVGPAFAPRILTSQGEIVYDLLSADLDTIKKEGLFKYYRSDEPLEFGLLVPRSNRFAHGLRDHPLLVAVLDRGWLVAQRRTRRRKRWRPVVVKASSQGQGKKCDVLISKKDAERIVAAEKRSGTLRKANVVVVVGTRVAGKRGRRSSGTRYARLDLR